MSFVFKFIFINVCVTTHVFLCASRNPFNFAVPKKEHTTSLGSGVVCGARCGSGMRCKVYSGPGVSGKEDVRIEWIDDKKPFNLDKLKG